MLVNWFQFQMEKKYKYQEISSHCKNMLIEIQVNAKSTTFKTKFKLTLNFLCVIYQK